MHSLKAEQLRRPGILYRYGSACLQLIWRLFPKLLRTASQFVHSPFLGPHASSVPPVTPTTLNL